MNRFEDDLKRALRREQAPAGFAGRVLARQAAPAPKARLWFRLRWAAAAAALAVVLVGAFEFRAGQHRRAQGELAKAQVLTALRITADKLEYTREKVVRLTSGGEKP